MKNYQSELALQQECYTEFHNTRPDLRGRLFAVNNNSQNAVKGSFNKAIGVLPGVSDMILLAPMGLAVFMEFKLPGGSQSPKQIQFQELVTSLHYHYHIIRDRDFFWEVVYRYYPLT